MKPEPLLAAFAKIERAKAQIDDLNSRINAFYEGHPYDIVSDVDAEGVEEIWRYRLPANIPVDIKVITGEIIHNIRSPLDQVLCALALQAGRTEGGVAFPFGRTRDEFETGLGKQKKLPSAAAELIRAAKPYCEGGNALLWAINTLNKRDKHRARLVPVFINSGMRMYELKAAGGKVLVLGSRHGQHMVTGGYTPRPRSPWPDEEYEFLTTTPGTKFEINAQPTFGIAFREIDVLQGQPVVACLHQMRDLVEGILLTFEKRFFS